jgi:hypothetical protein
MPPVSPPGRASVRFMYVRGLALWLLHGAASPRRDFSFQAGRYRYFSHRYNLTPINERAVEVPLALAEIAGHAPDRILEIGNVLSHYPGVPVHDVIDRYERHAQNPIIREDARYFCTTKRYDCIVSISTFEHVGWDESPRDPHKAWETIAHLRTLLSPSGTLFCTVPFGYHPALDARLLEERASFASYGILRRTTADNTWSETDPSTIRPGDIQFGRPFPFANALHVCRLGRADVARSV